MEIKPLMFKQSQAPHEADTVEESLVRLPRKWSFWENYEAKIGKLDYAESLKRIFEWDDLITFWQFWNSYPGSTPSNIFYNGERLRYFFAEKLRIVAMNLFEDGISPQWEDTQNKEGRILTLEYRIETGIDLFMQTVENAWTKLMLSLMGESIEGSKFVNGIRFVDKTQIGTGKKIMFRFEVWVNKYVTLIALKQLKDQLSKDFGCSGIDEKEIK